MPSSPASFGRHYSKPWAPSWQCRPHSTHRLMAKLNAQTEHWKTCYVLSRVIDKTIGTSTSLPQNSPATTPPMHPRACLLSVSTMDEIQDIPTRLSPRFQITSLQSTSSWKALHIHRRSLGTPLFKPRRIKKGTLTNPDVMSNLKLTTMFFSPLHTSTSHHRPNVPQRSSSTDLLAHIASFKRYLQSRTN